MNDTKQDFQPLSSWLLKNEKSLILRSDLNGIIAMALMKAMKDGLTEVLCTDVFVKSADEGHIQEEFMVEDVRITVDSRFCVRLEKSGSETPDCFSNEAIEHFLESLINTVPSDDGEKSAVARTVERWLKPIKQGAGFLKAYKEAFNIYTLFDY